MTEFLLGCLAGCLGLILGLKCYGWAADKIEDLKDRFREW